MAFETNIGFGLSLVNHGGQCCGIKTIHGFYYGPDHKIPALPAVKRNDKDQCGNAVASSERFFHDEAPEETYLERLDRLLDYVRRRRPANIVEAVLAEHPSDNYNYEYKEWDAVLLEKGFKKVTSGRNSNSGNTCHIYHLVIDEWDGGDDEEC